MASAPRSSRRISTFRAYPGWSAPDPSGHGTSTPKKTSRVWTFGFRMLSPAGGARSAGLLEQHPGCPLRGRRRGEVRVHRRQEGFAADAQEGRLARRCDGGGASDGVEQGDLTEAVSDSELPDLALTFSDADRPVGDGVVAIPLLALADDRGAWVDAHVVCFAGERLERRSGESREDPDVAQQPHLNDRDRGL